MLQLEYLPTRCCDCILRNDISIGKTICHVNSKKLADKECYQSKPKWCPLKEMPDDLY